MLLECIPIHVFLWKFIQEFRFQELFQGGLADFFWVSPMILLEIYQMILVGLTSMNLTEIPPQIIS